LPNSVNTYERSSNKNCNCIGGTTNTPDRNTRIRINDEIEGKELRIIGPEGDQLGIFTPRRALEMAEQYELDLVEIAPQATPPVCRIMDFGKFRYEQQKKEKLLKKRQQVMLVKEVRFHPNTDTHDLEFKVRHARQFLLDGNKVKASVVFRGRQMAHQEFGFELLKKVKEMLIDISIVERDPNMEGRAMIAIFSPDKKKIKTVTKKSVDDTEKE
jgi:translation initiation factor IF-3